MRVASRSKLHVHVVHRRAHLLELHKQAIQRYKPASKHAMCVFVFCNNYSFCLRWQHPPTITYIHLACVHANKHSLIPLCGTQKHKAGSSRNTCRTTTQCLFLSQQCRFSWRWVIRVCSMANYTCNKCLFFVAKCPNKNGRLEAAKKQTWMTDKKNDV